MVIEDKRSGLLVGIDGCVKEGMGHMMKDELLEKMDECMYVNSVVLHPSCAIRKLIRYMKISFNLTLKLGASSLYGRLKFISAEFWIRNIFLNQNQTKCGVPFHTICHLFLCPFHTTLFCFVLIQFTFHVLLWVPTLCVVRILLVTVLPSFNI